jgi:hypothetical protein
MLLQKKRGFDVSLSHSVVDLSYLLVAKSDGAVGLVFVQRRKISLVSNNTLLLSSYIPIDHEEILSNACHVPSFANPSCRDRIYEAVNSQKGH